MTPVSVLVCVPTVCGRQAALANCVRSYDRHTDVEYNLSIVHDAVSAGEGWQRCVDQGLEWWPQTTHIHFTNDDVAVAAGWLAPLLDSCARDELPAMRIEPAGGHVPEALYETHPPMPPAYDGDVPRDPVAYFLASNAQPERDREPIDHGNLPFCSVEQWRRIGPFPPIHYGTDRWFAERGRAAGAPTVARVGSVAFNYNIIAGRHRGDWTEQVSAAFDGVFALPLYLSGELRPDEPHPLRETPTGLAWARSWREAHEGVASPSDPRLMTDAGRAEMLREWRSS